MEYTNNGCLNLVIQTYYQNESLSKDKNNKNYYIKSLEKDMLCTINKHLTKNIVYLNTSRSCPTIMELKEYDYSPSILNRIKNLWNIMNYNQKQKMLIGYMK